MNPIRIAIAGVSAAVLLAAPVFAQNPEASPSASAPASPVATTGSGAPSAAEMQQMMELAKLNENHKLLGELAGDWNYTVKMWMDPSAPPMESKGTAVRKAIMGGRYYEADSTGKLEMPGPEGKMTEMTFKGKSLEGYDNVKKKFVSTWVDNMGTGIMMSEGTYDPATKTFTYTGEVEMMPGMKTQVREVLKVVDRDHHIFEWYENRGGQEVKTLEINYTRQK